MGELSAKEAVLRFIEAANALRACEPVEVGYALADALKAMPIKTVYALYAPARICEEQSAARLPEE